MPAAAAEEDVSSPTHVIGTGTPGSCTSTALATAVRGGGIVTFNCGPSPIIIELTSTLTTCNTHNCTHPWQGGAVNNKLVIDGGGGGRGAAHAPNGDVLHRQLDARAQLLCQRWRDLGLARLDPPHQLDGDGQHRHRLRGELRSGWTGTLSIRDSVIVDNSGERFSTAPYRDIFYLGKSLTVTNSTVE